MIQILPVQPNDRRNIRRFIDFPFTLYRDQPLWVPPLESELIRALERKNHPFFRHSDGDFFLVEKDDQVVGRIAVLHNRLYCERHQEDTAFFYYFESIDDRQVSGALFDAASAWARERRLTKLMGPKGFLRSNGQGLLYSGFEHAPALGIAYNPPYYDAHLQAAGFEKETDYFSGYLVASQEIPEKLVRAAEKVKERGNFTVMTFRNASEMRPWIEKIEEVHKEAFYNNPGYHPSTPEEFALQAQNILQIAVPGLIKLILKGDEVAGFVLGYPNIGRAIRRSRGRLLPLGWLRMLRAKQDTRQIDMNGIGFLPKHQGLGANALLYCELEKTLRQCNVQQAELVQVDERNFKSKSDMETLGVTWAKVHRTYRKCL